MDQNYEISVSVLLRKRIYSEISKNNHYLGLFAEKIRFNQYLEHSKLGRIKYKIFPLWCIRDLVQV